jgi:hypothetical protein
MRQPMNDRPDLNALLRAIADAEAQVQPDLTASLPLDLRSKFDLLRRDLNYMAMRAHALRPKITPAQPGG